MRKGVWTLVLLLLNAACAPAQVQEWARQFESCYYSAYNGSKPQKDLWTTCSSQGSSTGFYTCSEGIDALTAVYLATGELRYMDDCVQLCTNIAATASAAPGQRRSWVSKDTTGDYRKLVNTEVPLYESFWFRYLAKCLYVIRQKPSLMERYRQQYARLLALLEQDGWQKWYKRGDNKIAFRALKSDNVEKRVRENPVLMRSRTHMTAHWALTALYLSRITGNAAIKKECDAFTDACNKRLKSNMDPHPLNAAAYTWTATWKDAVVPEQVVQDVSHGNAVVAYIVECNSLGVYWTRSDIDKLCVLVKDVLYKPAEKTFYDNLDQSPLRDNTTKGIYQADGWVKLGRYNRQLFGLYADFSRNKDAMIYRHQQGQFFANMALNAKLIGQ